jgi:aminoglycoside 6'-N-acetyltransferase
MAHDEGAMASRVRLRDATPADAAILRAWEPQPHLIAAGIDDDWEWEKELLRKPSWRDQLIAELDGSPIGFVQIIDPAVEESHYWGAVEADLRAIDIWIGEAQLLGQGYGSEMMRQALERCFADAAVVAVLVDPLASNTPAHRFYRRAGFVEVGPRRFGDDDCLVMRIAREDW